MKTQTKQPTLAQFKAWAKDCEPAARAVLMARVFAQVQRERVDAYIRPIFDSYGFVYGKYGCERQGQRIEDPKNLYMVEDLDDPLMKAYEADCCDAHTANGFKGPRGHCPALVAENLVMTAERLLMELAHPLFGIEDVYGDNRVKYLELLIGACLKSTDRKAARS